MRYQENEKVEFFFNCLFVFDTIFARRRRRSRMRRRGRWWKNPKITKKRDEKIFRGMQWRREKISHGPGDKGKKWKKKIFPPALKVRTNVFQKGKFFLKDTKMKWSRFFYSDVIRIFFLLLLEYVNSITNFFPPHSCHRLSFFLPSITTKITNF